MLHKVTCGFFSSLGSFSHMGGLLFLSTWVVSSLAFNVCWCSEFTAKCVFTMLHLICFGDQTPLMWPTTLFCCAWRTVSIWTLLLCKLTHQLDLISVGFNLVALSWADTNLTNPYLVGLDECKQKTVWHGRNWLDMKVWFLLTVHIPVLSCVAYK